MDNEPHDWGRHCLYSPHGRTIKEHKYAMEWARWKIARLENIIERINDIANTRERTDAEQGPDK